MEQIGVIHEDAAIEPGVLVASDHRSLVSIPPESPGSERCLREWMIWDLRCKGYRFREIGELFGLTRQRVHQIERRLTRNAISRRGKRNAPIGVARRKRKAGPTRRVVSIAAFDKRLDHLNARYEKQLQHILEGPHRRRKFHSRSDGSGSTQTLFWKTWPCIEQYAFQPFTFSKLTNDHSALAGEPLLAQFLSRLRKQRLLKTIGIERTAGHSLPEITMVEASIDEYVAPMVDKLIVRWSAKLSEFEDTYLPIRPIESIDALRESLIQDLESRGITPLEIERSFAPTSKQISEHPPKRRASTALFSHSP